MDKRVLEAPRPLSCDPQTGPRLFSREKVLVGYGCGLVHALGHLESEGTD